MAKKQQLVTMPFYIMVAKLIKVNTTKYSEQKIYGMKIRV